jgi:hypothetical protein
MANDSRPPSDPTIVMMVQPEQLPVIEKTREPRRLLYKVHAAGEQWEVTYGNTGETALFDTQPEALLAARTAARAHWAAQSQPSGVTLEIGGASRLVALYGTEIPA